MCIIRVVANETDTLEVKCGNSNLEYSSRKVWTGVHGETEKEHIFIQRCNLFELKINCKTQKKRTEYKHDAKDLSQVQGGACLFVP